MKNNILRLFLILFMAISYCIANAQSFHAKVSNAQGKALAKVTVTANDSQGHIVKFCTTNDKGEFSFDSSSKAISHISLNIMGYEKKEIAVGKWQNGATIVLTPKDYVLKEVNIRPDRVRQHGDTLMYSVASFKQGQDRSIADVIRKMPGLEVSPTGQISYEGKAINKFYIEGMDLMGSKYAQASENLSADNVRRVEVYRGHQPVKSLRGVQFSDQAALNIVLKDNAKSAWTGIADIGVGAQLQSSNDMLYSGRLMAMVFGKKQQNLSMAKAENTGKDIASETMEFSNAQQSVETNDILANLSVSSPDIDESRTRFNTSYLATVNHLIRDKKDNDLRLQADYLWNRLEGGNYSETAYNDINGIVVSEETTMKAYENQLKGELTYTANKDKAYLKNTIKGLVNFNKSTGNTLVGNENILQQVKPRKRFLSEHFEMIRPLGSGTLKISSQTGYNYLPGKLLTIDKETEKLDVTSLNSNNVATFIFRIGKFHVANDVGFRLKSQKLDVDYMLESSSEHYRQQDFYIAPSLNLERNAIKLRAKVDAGLCHRDNGSDDDLHFRLQPDFYINYAATATTELSLNYLYRERDNDITSVFHTPIFTSYRSQTSHSRDLLTRGYHVVNLGVNYNQPVKGMFAYLSLRYNRMTNEMLYQSTLHGSKYLRQPTDKTYDGNAYSIFGRLSRSLHWAKTFISLTSSLTQSDLRLLRNEEEIPWRMVHANINLRVSMQPSKLCSFEVASNFDVSKQKDRSGNGSVDDCLKAFNHSFKAFLFLGKHIEIGINGDVYHSSDNSVSTNFFADAHVAYKYKRGELSLSMNNIFGNSNYERRIITTTTTQYSSCRLRPREILFKLSVDL